jgi:hypothetical protein
MQESSTNDQPTSTGGCVSAGLASGCHFVAGVLFFRTHASYSLRGMKRSEAELMQ